MSIFIKTSKRETAKHYYQDNLLTNNIITKTDMGETTTTNGSCEEQRPLESAEIPTESWYNKRKAKYTELAKKYLEENPKEKKYYGVEYPIGDDEYTGVYINFSDEEIKCIHHVLDDLTIEYHFSDFLQNPEEIIKDDNFDPSYKDIFKGLVETLEINQPDIEDIEGEWRDNITNINLDPVTLYAFRRIIFPKGFDKDPRIKTFYARLKDDNDYITLLTLKMMDRNLRFNELRHIMPEEYEYLSCQAEYDDPIFSTPGPYAVEMTEVDEDVFKIIGEESVSEEIYRKDSPENTEVATPKSRHTVLNIEEKTLSFFMEDITDDIYILGDREYIDNVNAIEVENAMGVSNYKGIIERIKTDFGGRDGVREFKKWLEDNSIKFQFTETHDTPNT